MSERDLLFEIGSEEIPAGFIQPALKTLSQALEKSLTSARLDFSGIETLGTPRRLVLVVRGLSELQPNITREQRGPKKEAAFDSDGNPTKALLGFLKGCGLGVDDVKTVKTERGEYVSVEKKEEGRPTVELLPDIFRGLMGKDLFPKSMRWGAGTVNFARPVHWLLALYGDDSVSFDYGDIASGRFTEGHRFVCATKDRCPEPFAVNSIDDYLKRLEEGYVVVDPAKRKEIIIEGIAHAAKEAGGEVLRDDGLVEEVTNLVEYPVVLRGGFDEEFLSLPKEIVVNAMREHQRYFSVVDADGNLLPFFITVANTPAKDPGVVVKGNERVLRARLSDANFYFETDSRTSMDDWVEKLKGVIFQAKLGTSYDKVERFTRLAIDIGTVVKYPDLNKLERAARFSKADLVSGVVMEFPKLQGLMGSKYAELAGETEEVCSAIKEHYMPVAAGSELPATDGGAIISIADKMDTIAGCFGVGLIPTGTKDPYALRRAALGILAILEESVDVKLDWLIRTAVDGIGDKCKDHKKTKDDIDEFFKERFKNQLMSRGLSFDAIDAVLSTVWGEITDTVARIEALEAFKKDPDCARLTMAFKRVSNILKDFDTNNLPLDSSLLEATEEKALYNICLKINPVIKEFREAHDYVAAFKELTALKEQIDSFFDEVMVMVDDEAIKNNRLQLLNSVRGLYVEIADLSKLSV